ncbi:MAG: TspO protein [Brevundimonas sp.]|uniref:TspO protein n=1 Tax=Brevundimonas sp. TaxID=1871086 RepID=UPI003919A1E2
MWDQVGRKTRSALNAEHRGAGHVAAGLAVAAGATLLLTWAATRITPPKAGPAITERPRGPVALILPAALSAASLSLLRVWNAPASPARAGALRLWGAAQLVNAVWIAIRPRSLGGQMLAAMSTAGVAAAFANRARHVDESAGKMAAPLAGAVRVGNRLDDALRS